MAEAITCVQCVEDEVDRLEVVHRVIAPVLAPMLSHEVQDVVVLSLPTLREHPAVDNLRRLSHIMDGATVQSVLLPLRRLLQPSIKKESALLQISEFLASVLFPIIQCGLGALLDLSAGRRFSHLPLPTKKSLLISPLKTLPL